MGGCNGWRETLGMWTPCLGASHLGGGRALDREPGQGSLQLLASLFYLLSLFFSFSFQAIYSME